MTRLIGLRHPNYSPALFCPLRSYLQLFSKLSQGWAVKTGECFASVPQSLMEGMPPVKTLQSLSMFKYVSIHTHIELARFKIIQIPVLDCFLLIGLLKMEMTCWSPTMVISVFLNFIWLFLAVYFSVLCH